ncbi:MULTISPECIES: hypothetical protein [unclassified Lentimicrobium]|uniref:hypothetical protein n=1 Tax=unclassified Lentimicrobium TaxID=2677434 RepID=UPI0015531424|nr:MULTISPECIES: hypothetical protein [unclassified Lentimicrobium]NPD46088.1 hypothetical protein [Lentimicrobium sp. S6]NPD84992.1 hypothetical protein [Lentimicrobium sp. L6]
MKKLIVFLLVVSVVLFVDYFMISLVGIFANLCEAGCGFYENSFGIISWIIIGLSMGLLAITYFRKALN